MGTWRAASCRASWSLAIALITGLLATGCGAGAFHMRAARDAVTIGRPAEGRAQVVFFMPEEARDVAAIVDQRGTYYGQVRGEMALVREVPPGRYRFYAIRQRNGFAVEVPYLAAGQTAYVGGVDPLLTSFVWRSMSGCDEVATRGRAALPTLARMEPDPDVALDTVLAEIGDIPRRTGEADRELEQMAEVQRALRTVDTASLERGTDCSGGASPEPAASAEPTGGGAASP